LIFESEIAFMLKTQSRLVEIKIRSEKVLLTIQGFLVGGFSTTEFSFDHNDSSKAEVHKVMAQAEKTGRVIVKPAHNTFWSGYVIFNPD